MSKTYRPYNPDQMFLLPPSLKEWLPEDHLVFFIDEVFNGLDLSAIEQVYEQEERGYPPYDPQMMVKVLFYAQCVGVRSSRKIERRIQEDVAFRILAANNFPKFRAISNFRRRHLKALAALFTQVLGMCDQAGLVKLKHVALDGTKIKANASKHKAMSYGRMKESEEQLTKEIERYLRKDQEIDEREDRKYGADVRGDELPPELATREKRLEWIRAAKAALEAAAREEQAKENDDDDPPAPTDPGPAKPSKRGRRKTSSGTPKDKMQYNFTDPESRIMLNADKAFIQGYNAQAVVDSGSQIVVAADVTNQASDNPQLPQMMRAVKTNLGRNPKEISADAGFFSRANLEFLASEEIDALIPPDKQRHNSGQSCSPRGRIPKNLSLADRMRRKLRTKHGREGYALRKYTVEPVFGQIKAARGFTSFLLRGLEKVRAEWLIACTAHNLLKLRNARLRATAAAVM
ncbi:MAG: IS1182 family transposase [Chitinophagales bacterium]